MNTRQYVEFKLPDSDKMTISFRSQDSLDYFLSDISEECEIINTYKKSSMRVSEIKSLMSAVNYYSKALNDRELC